MPLIKNVLLLAVIVFSSQLIACEGELSDQIMRQYLEKRFGPLSAVDGVSEAEREAGLEKFKFEILEVDTMPALRPEELEFGVLGMGSNYAGSPHNYLYSHIHNSGVHYEASAPEADHTIYVGRKARRAAHAATKGNTAVLADSNGIVLGNTIVRVPFKVTGTIPQLYRFFNDAPVLKAKMLYLDI
jgi:hypothetical protein